MIRYHIDQVAPGGSWFLHGAQHQIGERGYTWVHLQLVSGNSIPFSFKKPSPSQDKTRGEHTDPVGHFPEVLPHRAIEVSAEGVPEADLPHGGTARRGEWALGTRGMSRDPQHSYVVDNLFVVGPHNVSMCIRVGSIDGEKSVHLDPSVIVGQPFDPMNKSSAQSLFLNAGVKECGTTYLPAPKEILLPEDGVGFHSLDHWFRRIGNLGKGGGDHRPIGIPAIDQWRYGWCTDALGSGSWLNPLEVCARRIPRRSNRAKPTARDVRHTGGGGDCKREVMRR